MKKIKNKIKIIKNIQRQIYEKKRKKLYIYKFCCITFKRLLKFITH